MACGRETQSTCLHTTSRANAVARDALELRPTRSCLRAPTQRSSQRNVRGAHAFVRGDLIRGAMDGLVCLGTGSANHGPIWSTWAANDVQSSGLRHKSPRDHPNSDYHAETVSQ
jgi:hypothetical protein